MQWAAVVVVALLVVSGIFYFGVYTKPSKGYATERIVVQIAAAYYNASDPDNLNGMNSPGTYYPNSFDVPLGDHVSLVITNTDNMTHGLAVPKFNLDTGLMRPNATVTLEFVAAPLGNITFYEPHADCGGGSCDSGQQYNGTITVIS